VPFARLRRGTLSLDHIFVFSAWVDSPKFPSESPEYSNIGKYLRTGVFTINLHREVWKGCPMGGRFLFVFGVNWGFASNSGILR